MKLHGTSNYSYQPEFSPHYKHLFYEATREVDPEQPAKPAEVGVGPACDNSVAAKVLDIPPAATEADESLSNTAVVAEEVSWGTEDAPSVLFHEAARGGDLEEPAKPAEVGVGPACENSVAAEVPDDPPAAMDMDESLDNTTVAAEAVSREAFTEDAFSALPAAGPEQPASRPRMASYFKGHARRKKSSSLEGQSEPAPLAGTSSSEQYEDSPDEVVGRTRRVTLEHGQSFSSSI